ncbi:hypothetical protein SprV_0100196200 [Sparganum proliferum]
MATLKPIGTDKKKQPFYFEDIVQIYGPVPRNPKAPFNPSDGQKALKKLLEQKKSVKAKLTAGTSGLFLKKKGAFGKKPKIEQVAYSSLKNFYQFSDNPGCVVLAADDKTIKPQYIIVAPTSVDKTVKFVNVLQTAQWAEKSNLKNAPVPLVVVDNSAVLASSRRSSAALSHKSLTEIPTPSARESRRSSTSSSRSERIVETPHEPRRESLKSRSVSSSSSSRSSRSPCYEVAEQKGRSPSPVSPPPPSVSSRHSRKSHTSFSSSRALSTSPYQSRKSPVSKSKTPSRTQSRSSSSSSSSFSRSPSAHERVTSRASLADTQPTIESSRQSSPEPTISKSAEVKPKTPESKPSKATGGRRDSKCHFVAFDKKSKAAKKYRSSSSSSSSSETECYSHATLPNGGLYYLAPHRNKNITRSAAAAAASSKPRQPHRSRIFLYRAESSSSDSTSSSSESDTELKRFKYPQPFTSQQPLQRQPQRVRDISTSSSSSSDSDSSEPRQFLRGVNRQRT